MSKWLKLVSTAAVLTVLLITAVAPAYAFDGRGGEKVTIRADEVINDDLYVGANEFVLEGTVNGDLVAGGQTLTINGTVNGNLIAGGQTVVVNGTITGDVLAAGSVLLFGEKASIGGDVVGAGYSFEFRKGGGVGRDAVLAAGQILMAADVARDLQAAAGALEIAGTIGGDVKAAVGEAGAVQAGPGPTAFMPQSPIQPPVVRQGLTIDKNAKIQGDLEYTQNSELVFPAGVVVGSVSRLDQPEATGTASRTPTASEQAGTWALSTLRTLVTLLLVGLLLLRLAPAFMRNSAAEIGARPWPSLGWGVVTYAGFFFLLLLSLFVTILGALVFGLLSLDALSRTIAWTGVLLLFALILGFALVTAFVAKIVYGLALGRWILSLAKSPVAAHGYLRMIVGVAITVLIPALLAFPGLTGLGTLARLLDFGMILFGLGAIWLWLRPKLGRRAPSSA
jgi:cytoskeletal protein CcmA (bactofilin family)